MNRSISLPLLACGALTACSNRLFLHPSHTDIAVSAQRESIPCESWPIRGRRLDAFLRRIGPPDCPPAAIVLAFHGNGSRPEIELDAVARLFSRHFAGDGAKSCAEGGGLEIVAVAYPGYGRDRGRATLRGLGAGALEAYDWVHARADGVPVIVYGFSMGGAAALHVARQRAHAPPAALVLDRGPNIPRLVAGRFGWWNLFVIAGPVLASLPRAVHSRANARKVGDIPALFLVGRRDRLARPRNVETIVSAYAGPKLAVWFDGDHGTWVDGDVDGVREGMAWLLDAAGVR